MRSRNPTIYEIIPQIYDGMLDPGRLASVGESIVQLVGGHTGVLVSRTRSMKGTVFSEIAYNVDLSSAKAWETTFSAFNPFRREENQARAGDVLSCSKLVVSEDYKKSVFYNEWARKRDHWDYMGIVLDKGQSAMDYFAILKPHSGGLMTPADIDRMRILGPHLRRAFTTSALIQKYRAQAKSLGDLIATAGFGVVLVTATRQITYVNDAAEALMQSHRGLGYAHGRVCAKDPHADRKLEAMVLCASRPNEPSQKGGTLPLLDDAGAFSHIMHVIPLSASSSLRLLDKERPVVGLFIVDLSRETTFDRIRAFAGLYNLTPGESRFMAKLISGEGLIEAAERLKITEGTARTHLKHIFAKTDTHRQAELLRLFFEVTIPWVSRASHFVDRCVA
jgi:DNA-binding CsgD family transcriptional regulator